MAENALMRASAPAVISGTCAARSSASFWTMGIDCSSKPPAMASNECWRLCPAVSTTALRRFSSSSMVEVAVFIPFTISPMAFAPASYASASVAPPPLAVLKASEAVEP